MTKPKAKAEFTKNDQRTAESNHEDLVRELNKVKEENKNLREIQANLNQRLFQQKNDVRNDTTEVDLQKRTHDGLIMELLSHSDRLKERAQERARTCLVNGWERDEMLPHITVELRIAAGVRKCAEKIAGHSFEFTVPGMIDDGFRTEQLRLPRDLSDRMEYLAKEASVTPEQMIQAILVLEMHKPKPPHIIPSER